VPGRDDRAAFRAWVRVHHPDVGGDPDTFAEGLRRFRTAAGTGGTRPATVVVVRRRPWPARRLARWRERRERARRLL
jgi:hypothetical protein